MNPEQAPFAHSYLKLEEKINKIEDKIDAIEKKINEKINLDLETTRILNDCFKLTSVFAGTKRIWNDIRTGFNRSGY